MTLNLLKNRIQFGKARRRCRDAGRSSQGPDPARRPILRSGLAVLLAVIGPSVVTVEDAVEAVSRIYTTTLQTRADPARLADRLESSVDLRALATRVLGAAYTDATPAERADFEAVFLDVIALDLSERVRGDRQLAIFRTRSLDNGDIIVFSRIDETRRHAGSDRLEDAALRRDLLHL